jgi:hypothetical protein
LRYVESDAELENRVVGKLSRLNFRFLAPKMLFPERRMLFISACNIKLKEHLLYFSIVFQGKITESN